MNAHTEEARQFIPTVRGLLRGARDFFRARTSGVDFRRIAGRAGAQDDDLGVAMGEVSCKEDEGKSSEALSPSRYGWQLSACVDALPHQNGDARARA